MTTERMTDTARWYRERLGLAEEVIKTKDAEIARLQEKDAEIERLNKKLSAWAEQDAHSQAQIQALADALWETGDDYGEMGWHTPTCALEGAGIGKPCTEQCASRRSALHLVGRL